MYFKHLLWKKKKTLKRQKTDTTTDSDSDNENTQHIQNWPRFLLIQSADSEIPLSKLSPFAVQKGNEGIAGKAKDIKDCDKVIQYEINLLINWKIFENNI